MVLESSGEQRSGHAEIQAGDVRLAANATVSNPSWSAAVLYPAYLPSGMACWQDGITLCPASSTVAAVSPAANTSGVASARSSSLTSNRPSRSRRPGTYWLEGAPLNAGGPDPVSAGISVPSSRPTVLSPPR